MTTCLPGFGNSFVYATAQLDGLSADNLKSLGFPDTADKLNRYADMRGSGMDDLSSQRYLTVFDDVHLLKNPDVIKFIERLIRETPENLSVILISREFPHINIAGLQAKGDVSVLHENDLNFTESELTEYLRFQGLSVGRPVLYRIFQDINGWAYAANLVARSLKNSPDYSGFVSNAIKKNIFILMESEVYDVVSEPLKRFLIRLSLIERLSAELVETLTAGDELLLAEFNEQSAYIRYDSNSGAYLIHHIFLDFLRSKHGILTDEEKRETYRAAAEWCRRHDSTTDALDYYEKVGDYESIIFILIRGCLKKGIGCVI